jgi:hypothetical protein
MGHTGKRERKKGRSHRADGREKRGFESMIRLPISERDRRPIAIGIESEETAESIHFAPPLTWRFSYGAKLGLLRCRVQ